MSRKFAMEYNYYEDFKTLYGAAKKLQKRLESFDKNPTNELDNDKKTFYENGINAFKNNYCGWKDFKCLYYITKCFRSMLEELGEDSLRGFTGGELIALGCQINLLRGRTLTIKI